MIEKLKKRVRNNPWVWKNYSNGTATKSYVKPSLSQELQQIVSTLRENGIAFSDFESVFTGIDFEEFREKVNAQLDQYDQEGMSSGDTMKSYFDFVLGLNPTFDAASIWNQVSTHNNMQSIADSYFQMKGTKMRYYNIWRHRATNQNPSGSQLWHRDREDLRILKVFVCLEDVSETTGPFSYAPGTQLGGDIDKIPASYQEPDGTHRTTDEMMNEVVPREQWIRATGKRGSVIFADTHGYHKGGHVREGVRLLFTTMYVSPVCGRRYFRDEHKVSFDEK